MFNSRMFALVAAAMSAPLTFGLPIMIPRQIHSGVERKAPKRWEQKVRPLNRSRHWAPALDYKHARRISPFPGMPIR